jgi:outer membrane protein OmpA-like peptidoglycan-associated protein
MPRLPVIVASVLVLLAGCAAPLRVTEPASQSPQQPARLIDPGAPRASAGRIAQQRSGSEATVRLVAMEPAPTPKTLADGGRPLTVRTNEASHGAAPGPSAARAAEPARGLRTASMRVREPAGAVYFASAGSQVSAAALPTLAAAVARAGRADRFVLTAYTDPYGSREVNRRLAELRAESVTAALAVRGVDRAQVVVLSRPQCCAVQPLPEREAAPYRRVDIEILTHRAVLPDERAHGSQPHS